MQVAAGLGERTEQVIFTQTEAARAGSAKSPASLKETDDKKFHRLFDGLITDEKEKAKKSLQNSREGNEELWSKLMLLYPELATLVVVQEQVAEGEAEAELLAAVENDGELLLQHTDPAPEAAVSIQADFAETLEAIAEAPEEERLVGTAVDEPGLEANELSVETAEGEGIEGIREETEPQSSARFDTNSPETPVHSTAETMTMHESQDHTPFEHNAMKEPAGISVDASTDSQPQPELSTAEGKRDNTVQAAAAVATGAPAGKSETVETAGNFNFIATTATKIEPNLSETPETQISTSSMPETADPVRTAESAVMVGTAARAESTEVKTARTVGIMGTSQADMATIKAENPAGFGSVETAETDGEDHDALTAPLATTEHEAKTAFRAETAAKESHLNRDLLGQNFSPVVGEAPIREQNPEVTAVQPEPVAPENAREDLATQIMSGARLMVKDGVTKIQIQLEPAELGKLELSLVLERDLVAARFVTETQGVQSLIEANLPELRSALEEAGLQVDLLQVGVQTGTDSQMPNQNMTSGEQFKRNAGWNPTAEMYVLEEQILGEEAWHGMVNLRI
ncbi:MAG: hypothetical protein GX770_04395 [Firmicutes bacterium]|nr:hypothetical protein [Bacillota bacterium]